MDNLDIKEMERYAQTVVSPIMTEYTKWIINECKKRNIKKIYFLARDGYLLHLIAKQICTANKLDIEIKYLYCSRYSLRMPTFNLIGDEKYKTLFLVSCRCTLNGILKRAGLTDTQCETIAQSLQIDQYKILNNSEFENIKNTLIKDDLFNQILAENSTIAYNNTIKYLKQEGLFDDDIVIADSGWTGSMQRSIRQLADSVGFSKKIIGFYFGMFKHPNSEDGEYLTYYFSGKGNLKRKLNFNNNLFECMLSANHGMTMGYELKNNKMAPIMQPVKKDNMHTLVQTQIDSVINHTKTIKNQLLINNFDLKKSHKYIYKIIKRAMIYPSKNELKMLENIYFCDDITGNYQIPLVSKNSIKTMKAGAVLPRIFRKMFRKKYALDRVYWPYGTIAYQNRMIRPWYRLNYKFMYFIRYKFYK